MASSMGRSTSAMQNGTSTNPIAANRPRNGPNGVNNKARLHNESKPTGTPLKESNPDKHAHDRLLFLVASFIGRTAKVTVKNGHQYVGIFSGSSFDTSESHYVLKMARKLSEANNKSNGLGDELSEGYAGYGTDHVMTFDIKDVVDLAVTEVSLDNAISKLPNGTSSSFRTDTDISGNGVIRERELQRWEPGAETGIDLSLTTTAGGWDQFETNERLFNVTTDYDENIYTTSIDRSHPTYKQRAAMADKLAREIEGTTSTNTHVAEERGQASERDGHLDEEDKYSGVRREFSPLVSTQNRYTPPARRAPTGHSTVVGAPVDPAIISAQLPFRPDSSASRAARPSNPVPAAGAEAKMKENVEPDNKAANVVVAPSSGVEPVQPSKLTSTLRQTDPTKALENKTATNAGPSSANARPPAILVNNGTTNVEKKVFNEFKEFAMHEKMRIMERGREHARNNARKEYEMKLNDLKKFASNFKLKSAVPEDMLGILAKDKHKQMEIVERSQRQQKEAEDHARQSNPVTAVNSPSSTRLEATITSPVPMLEKQPSRTGQPTQSGAPVTLKGPHAPPLRTGPGHLGQRLMSQPQYQNRGLGQYAQQLQMPDQRGPMVNINGNTVDSGAAPANSLASPTSAALRFNVQAMEFRPNPAASAFSPRTSKDEGVTSPSHAKAAGAPRSPVKASFFSSNRPCAANERLSFKDGFNPITRMKREEAEKDPKKFTTNGGIPQAYRTPPTWPVSEANKEKSYMDMFEKATPVPVNVPGVLPHQHQLPMHLQPGHPGMPQQLGHHQLNGRDHHFDDHRMHPSTSSPGVFASPRFQQPMLAYQQSPMIGHMQPGFAQPIGQLAFGPNGPIPIRQFSGAQQFSGPHLTSAPMMVNHSSGGTFMNMPVQQMPMYSPGQNGVFPGHVGGVPNGFSSPRMAPPMVHQGSQQGQAPYMYLNQQQVFVQQHPGQMQQMRPGIPVMNPNFPNSPNFQQHFPQNRGNFYGGNFNPQQQQMGPNHNNHQAQPQVNPVVQSDAAENK